MSASRAVREGRAVDARLTVEVAAACMAAFAVFVVAPYYAADLVLPPGLDAVWSVGGLLTIVIAPVVAGLAAYVSIGALWLHGDVLSTSTRRLHLLTLLLVAALLLGYVSTWGSSIISWWMD